MPRKTAERAGGHQSEALGEVDEGGQLEHRNFNSLVPSVSGGALLTLKELLPLKIRRYSPGEEQAVWEVVYRATRESNARDYHPQLIDRWAPHDKDMSEWRERLKKTNPFVAIVETRIAGMAEIESSGFIDHFYVHPRFQSRGIGKALLAKLTAEAEGFGVSEIFANVSLTAKPFFASQGFEVTEARANVILGHPAPNFAMTRQISREQGRAGSRA